MTRTGCAVRSLSILLSLMLASVHVAIHAQQTDLPAATLPDVVVSASRQAQRSFDAPASIQAIDADLIGLAGPRVNLTESINRIPGVNAANRQNYAQDLQISIRGFGSRSTFGIRGVRLIVDGIPATMPDGQGQASTISLPSAGRIEVLRGPLAQLYGNASGGVLQVFTREAEEPATAGIDFTSGSFGERRIGARAGGRFGALGLTVDASDFETDGYRDHSNARRRQLNAKATWDAGPDTRITLVGNRFDQPLALDPLGLTRAQAEADPRQSAPIAFQQDARKTVVQDQAGLVVEHRLDASQQLTARLHVGRRDLFQALAIPPAAQLAPTAAGGIIELDRHFDGGALSWQGSRPVGDGRAELLLGVESERMQERRRGFTNVGGQPGPLRRDEDNRVSSNDIFALATWHLAQPFSLTGGVRSSRVRFETDDDFITATNPDDSGRVGYSATSPVIGITWHARENVNLFATIGRGFETPTFAELAYRPQATGLNDALRASRSTHAEFGVKAQLGASHRIDATLFGSRTTDEIVVDTNQGGRSTFRNAGRTQREGVELAWVGTLTPNLGVLVSASTLDARFRDRFVTPSAEVPAGARIPGAPEWLHFAELDWRERGVGSRIGWHAGVELAGSGRTWVDDLNSDAAGRWLTAALRAGWNHRLGPWRFGVLARIDNVADRQYFGSVIVNESQRRHFEPAPGRRWLAVATLGYEFR